MFKVSNKDTRAMSLMSVWCLYCQLYTYIAPFSGNSIVNFEHVIAGWVLISKFVIYFPLSQAFSWQFQ